MKIIVLGGGCSVSTVPIARTTPYFGLTQVAYSATSPELSQRALFPTFFRTSVSDLAISKPVIELCKQYNWHHVATLQEQDEMFTTTMNHFHYLLRENNMTLVTAESFLLNPTQNIRNIIMKDARIVFFSGYERSARKVFCQIYLQGAYGARYQWIIPGWYNDNWMDVNDTICTNSQIKEAAMYVISVIDIKRDVTGMRTISGMTYAEYEARYFDWPTIDRYGYNAYHPTGYDAVWAIALALNSTAQIIGQENISEVINGSVHVRPKRLDDFRYRDSPDIAAAILSAMNEVNFHGVSGPISFNVGEIRATIGLSQIQESGMVQFAIYVEESNDLIYIEETEIKWHGDFPPKSTTEQVFVTKYKNEILIICACVLAGVGVLVAILFLTFNIKNREHKHIKMSSPRLNNLIIFGMILAYITVVLFGLDGQFVPEENMPKICTSRAWFLYVSFTLSFGGMFAKTWRVHVIFTGKFSRVNKPVHDIHLFSFVVVLLLVVVAILTAWTLTDPFYQEMRNISQTEINDYPVIQQISNCTCNYFWWWLTAIWFVNGVLLVFGCFLAWETRNVSIPGLNDSRFIGMCVYNVVIMCAVGVTVTLALPERNDIRYAFQAACIMFCAYSSLFVLFVPKIRHVLRHPQDTGVTRATSTTNTSSTFKYTIEHIRQRSTTQLEGEGNLSSVFEELRQKDNELTAMKKKYLQLERVLNDFILTKWQQTTNSRDNNSYDGGHNTAHKSLPKIADIFRMTSSSCPSRIRGRSYEETSRDTVEKREKYGADNSAFS